MYEEDFTYEDVLKVYYATLEKGRTEGWVYVEEEMRK